MGNADTVVLVDEADPPAGLFGIDAYPGNPFAVPERVVDEVFKDPDDERVGIHLQIARPHLDGNRSRVEPRRRLADDTPDILPGGGGHADIPVLRGEGHVVPDVPDGFFLFPAVLEHLRVAHPLAEEVEVAGEHVEPV
ncbi:hypothetical protein DSECCO2_608800 [anaerobic digester metagenome]